MGDIRGYLLPIYVLVDESYSMKDDISELNAGLSSLHAELLGQPMAAAKVRITVLGFAENVIERVRLADLRELYEMPPLAARKSTNYEAAFEDLIRRIPADIAELKGQRYALYRPTVFFLSDGQPDNAKWLAVHKSMSDRAVHPWAPNIIACGIGSANPQTILQIATAPRFAFVAIEGAQLGPSIGHFCTELTQSIVNSATAAANGGAPEVEFKPEGFAMVLDVI